MLKRRTFMEDAPPLIRPAALKEHGALEDLQRRASLTNAGDRLALLAHPDAVELPEEHIGNGRVFVLEGKEGIAGFATMLPRTDGDAELDALFVEPAMQRKGVGRALVAHCASVARSRGSAMLHVVANPHAERFYTACGFEGNGTASTRFGPALLMRRIV